MSDGLVHKIDTTDFGTLRVEHTRLPRAWFGHFPRGEGAQPAKTSCRQRPAGGSLCSETLSEMSETTDKVREARLWDKLEPGVAAQVLDVVIARYDDGLDP